MDGDGIQFFKVFEVWSMLVPDGDSRMELFGRIVHALEFGVPRQKLFVCVRQKVVNNPNCVALAWISKLLFLWLEMNSCYWS